MPRRPHLIQRSAEATAIKLATAAETVVCTLTPISPDVPGAVVSLEATASITLGATGTACNFRIRRGTTTAGAQIAVCSLNNLVAASKITAQIQCQDQQAGDVASQQYVLTVENVGATTEGEANQADIVANY